VRIEIDHPHPPAVDGNAHAAAVVEVVKNAFGAGEHRQARPRERAFGQAALRSGGSDAAHLNSGSMAPALKLQAAEVGRKLKRPP
jgi:hypothetical protein